jgi:hypothetical protein
MGCYLGKATKDAPARVRAGHGTTRPEDEEIVQHEEVNNLPIPGDDAPTKEGRQPVGVRFRTKDDVVLEDMKMLHPKLLIVLGHFIVFAEKRGLPVKITSIVSDRKNVQAASRTHEEGRAIDVSSLGWGKRNVKDCIAYMMKVANHYGAISASDLERRVIIHHNFKNQGDHFHLQVAKDGL